jgi:4-hydroxy-3-methylbut-2-enyl diphosphate reductase IspH
MNGRDGLTAYILVVCTLLAGWASHAAEGFSGSWTIEKSDEPGKVEFALIHHQHGNSSTHSSTWPLSVFVGLDVSKTGKQEVKFTITRDAGRLDCEGYLDNGEGAGTYHFLADPKYVGEMKTLGFTGIDEEKQYSMAVLDVSLNFAKAMRGEHLQGLDTDKLIAFRIFNVNSEFIRELRDAGITVTDCDKLVAFRIHGVTPEMVRFLHKSGYQPGEDKLIAMRIHGATPEFMEQLQKDGYQHVDLDKLIAFRIHGVSPEFIEKVQALGYKHPEPDQLIAMRIHGVTPEYISGLKSRGMQNLSIDQLVSLRIQGID